MLINEIFYSLQGEGVHMGKASIFIRLSRCKRAGPPDPAKSKGPGKKKQDLFRVLPLISQIRIKLTENCF